MKNRPSHGTHPSRRRSDTARVASEKAPSKKGATQKKGAPKAQKTAKATKTKAAAPKKEAKATERAAKPERKASAPRAERAKILELIGSLKGATLAEIMKATDWQAPQLGFRLPDHCQEAQHQD